MAPGTLTHETPAALQRCQWYWNAVGLLLHVPFCAVSVSPTRGVPVIVGGAVLTGGAASAGTVQTSTAPITAPRPSSLVFTAQSFRSVFLVANEKTAEMGARSGRRRRSASSHAFSSRRRRARGVRPGAPRTPPR